MGKGACIHRQSPDRITDYRHGVLIAMTSEVIVERLPWLPRWASHSLRMTIMMHPPKWLVLTLLLPFALYSFAVMAEIG